MNENENKRLKPHVDYNYYEDNSEEEDLILNKVIDNKLKYKNFGKNELYVDSKLREELLKYYKTSNIVNYDINKHISCDNISKNSNDDSSLIGPEIPLDFETVSNKKSVENLDESNSATNKTVEVYDSYSKIPIDYNLSFIHSKSKSITSLDIDKQGLLLISSSLEGSLNYWEYSSLTRIPKPTRSITINEEMPITGIEFNASSGYILVSSTDTQAKIYRRDGTYEVQCYKGDLYLQDLSLTKGHTLPVTDGHFNPTDKHLFATCSRDSTIRLWDMNSNVIGIKKELKQSVIIKSFKNKNSSNYGRVSVTACCYNIYGNLIAGGLNNKSIQIFDTRKKHFFSPDIFIKNAHTDNDGISCIKLLSDNNTLISRGYDDCINIWDVRYIKDNKDNMLYSINNLYSNEEKVSFSLLDNDDILMVPVNYKQSESKLLFFDLDNMVKNNNKKITNLITNYIPIKEVEVCKDNIISCIWSKRNNQIALGTSEGIIHNFFNVDKNLISDFQEDKANDNYNQLDDFINTKDSKLLDNNKDYNNKNTVKYKGIINSLFKISKKKQIDDTKLAQPIITSEDGNPIFENDNFDYKAILEKLVPDNENSIYKVNRPLQGPGSIGYKGPSMFSGVANALYKNIYEEEDPIELLKKFENCKKDGKWVDNAYKSKLIY